MKILLGNFNAGRVETPPCQKIWLSWLTMFPPHNIHKYTWTSLDGRIHNQTDHILMEKRWYSNTVHVWSFRGADCDTDHYLVLVSKQAAQICYVERFNLRKLNYVEVKEQQQVKISNKFAALENLMMMMMMWKILQRIWQLQPQSLDYELKQHKPQCDDECSK